MNLFLNAKIQKKPKLMRLSVLRKYSGTNGHMSDYRTESSEPKNALNTISIEYKSLHIHCRDGGISLMRHKPK